MYPKWTVHANVTLKDSRWLGQSWEFFDDEQSADQRYAEHLTCGNVPTKRPFHPSDLNQMAAADKSSICNA